MKRRRSSERYPGRVYHLYQRAADVRYGSLLSPEEWGGSPPHPFLGSYRLESDQSSTPLAAHASERVAGPETQGVEAWLKARLLRKELP